MRAKIILTGICISLLTTVAWATSEPAQKGQFRWAVHDMNRPQPPIVTAGERPGQPPSDAIILFDGTGLSQWVDPNGEPARWKLENGCMYPNGKGDILTKQSFGDCQLHVEWASPPKAERIGQKLGNSGVYLMNLYEVQVLDSYNNKTYPDGQAAAVYGQYPPLVNVCRKPGQWQSYDIIFHRPKFDKNGSVLSPGRFTVLHNGVLVQDNVELYGPTVHKRRAKYRPHPAKLPLKLQDHGDPVRYRNIWIRQLS